MANPEHLKILKQGVEVWNKWRKKTPNIKPQLAGADLSGMDPGEIALDLQIKRNVKSLGGANLSKANLVKAHLGWADLGQAKLWEANLRWANLSFANLRKANLRGAALYSADLTKANLEKANLKDADLRICRLIGCNLTGAVLTATKLYGTSRDEWIIKDVKCEYVYWDYKRKQRSPKERDLEPGEFERLYAALPFFEYVFEHGMSPIDPLVMVLVIETLRERRPEWDIRIDSINARGLAPSIRFTVLNEQHKEAARKEVRKEYETKLKLVEQERDRYWQVIKSALDKPREIKLISAGRDATVAMDSATINIEQHIHNALQLQKAIAEEPEESESFAKVVKKTALDIIGGAIKDIAKGQVKEAAKQIIELGKDLGPIIAKMAAYSFFSNIGG